VLRRRLSLSQEELALRVGLNRGNIASYENGTAEPKICNLFKLSTAFGVSIIDLTQRDLNQDENYQQALVHYREVSSHHQELVEQHLQRFDELQSFMEGIFACYQYKAKGLGEVPREFQFLLSSFEELFQASQQLLGYHQELIEFIRCKKSHATRPAQHNGSETVSL
jgi:transcriptional regulator with XRE-family HTH domain